MLGLCGPVRCSSPATSGRCVSVACELLVATARGPLWHSPRTNARTCHTASMVPASQDVGGPSVGAVLGVLPT